MNYTVITKTGKVKQFYIKAVAEMFVSMNGGTLISEQLIREMEVA
jgi:hypothetical protein